ncbi:MAG: hypothetical protein AMK72_10115 [Planctomycetes bacterium SM23_25]|nr:MAG: hypothetical protein AMK72_10115 [Planctomycetes bacterium SM23_25]
MDPRREQLVRLLHRRRRRIRLMLVCLATALACGLVADIVGPRILIGGVPHDVSEPAASEGKSRERLALAAGPLELSERLALDPRETQANAIRWQSLRDDHRRAVLDRYWQLAEMDAGERESVFDRYAAFRQLPEKRQEFYRTRARQLKAFMATLSPQDRAVLAGMSDEDRARRLLDLWQARYGTW